MKVATFVKRISPPLAILLLVVVLVVFGTEIGARLQENVWQPFLVALR